METASKLRKLVHSNNYLSVWNKNYSFYNECLQFCWSFDKIKLFHFDAAYSEDSFTDTNTKEKVKKVQ